MAKPPSKNNCSFEEKTNKFPIVTSVNGDIGTKTPITLAILFAPKL